MSWDQYIDNLRGHTLVGDENHCDKVCIIALDGGAKWTSDAHPNAIKITPAEAAVIAKAMKDDDFAGFQSKGIYIESVKYQFLREDDGIVLAKRKEHGAMTLQKSKTCIVIGHTKEGGSQGVTNKGVGVIADYLTSVNC